MVSAVYQAGLWPAGGTAGQEVMIHGPSVCEQE